MSPLPYRIHGVMDHAVIRFFQRVRMPGYDMASVGDWIMRHRGELDDSAILDLLKSHGVVVGYFRKTIHDDADTHKRRAVAMPDGKWLIRGRFAPYVVTRGGYVITTKQLKLHASEELLPLFGRWREMANA
jgi:hypothetical protein